MTTQTTLIDMRGRFITLPSTARPLLFVVVDTEEEFDWDAPFSRDNTSVTAIRRLPDFQKVMDGFGIRPTYVIDYPVATRPESFSVIAELADRSGCEIGAHLHPWVTPPFTENVNRTTSFGCNLGDALEEAKIRELADAIQGQLGIRPRVYKAGRYGLGHTTLEILKRLQFAIDVSVNPSMNFSAEDGPDFRGFDARPFVFRTRPGILEVPCTTAFSGMGRIGGERLHAVAARQPFRAFRLTGVLRRTGVLDKVMLSPEMSTLAEMQAVTRSLLADGVRTFTMTLHSPSVEPGHTPYVRTDRDRRDFLRRIADYCEFFFKSIGGLPGTLHEFRESVLHGDA